MRTAASSALVAAAAFAIAALSVGCASDPGCKPGNEKIDGTCRLLCAKQSDCPDAYACVASGAKNYCKPSENGLSTAQGQYGSACRAILKQVADHPDCAAGFACYGQSPGDGEAYCSKYGCSADTECPGGFYCATVNMAPNAATYQRSWGQTTTVCAKRAAFCTPCSSDIDCDSRGYTGPKMRCVADAKGAKYCTNECATDGNCSRDASCKDVSGTKVCTPNFGACSGAGALCDRCSSDANCKQGAFCFEQEYTKERACTAVPEGGACAAGKCGAPPAGAPWSIGCAKSTNGLTPTDQCVGLRDFGTDNSGQPVPYIGCWAANAPEK